MSTAKPALTDTFTFWTGLLGIRITARFAEQIREHGLKPKHVGLLNSLAAGDAVAQQDLARSLRVAPSLVVALIDQLEDMGAAVRQRSTGDRRRQTIAITDRGRELLAACAAAAAALDRELLAGLNAGERKAARSLLRRIATDWEGSTSDSLDG